MPSGSTTIVSALQQLDRYAIIKMARSFPEVPRGSDIDIIVDDVEKACASICRGVSLRPDERLCVSRHDHRAHVDVVDPEGLRIRFDLIDTLSVLTRVGVRSALTTKVLDDRVPKAMSDNVIVFVPALEDELTIRYLEYLEHFERTDLKDHHLEVLLDHAHTELFERFIENTHRYIHFAPPRVPRDASFAPANIRQAIDAFDSSSRYIAATVLAVTRERVVRALPRPVHEVLKWWRGRL